jgi:hypothetical protein
MTWIGELRPSLCSGHGRFGERNARVFRNKHAPSTVIFNKMKEEAKLLLTACGKGLSELMSRE